ncbi:hypothetical protein K503DRAFT_766562 [Rhizopogon vinicolor AM-OR11-026]|uniref:Uncharacterized protein n=1 Tax=Rhizopogon vinicolor AM-OR11-026 TaxID=1314800 RepID=A0A1B7NCR7_9AGAM|nr:hypothetical protein K503DRAFT_766562 [Rhizopogon vinicolor AM-OR11-026]
MTTHYDSRLQTPRSRSSRRNTFTSKYRQVYHYARYLSTPIPISVPPSFSPTVLPSSPAYTESTIPHWTKPAEARKAALDNPRPLPLPNLLYPIRFLYLSASAVGYALCFVIRQSCLTLHA